MKSFIQALHECGLCDENGITKEKIDLNILRTKWATVTLMPFVTNEPTTKALAFRKFGVRSNMHLIALTLINVGLK